MTLDKKQDTLKASNNFYKPKNFYAMGWVFFIILALFCIVLLLGGSQKTKNAPYHTKARLIQKLDKMPHCWLCTFEQNDKEIVAIYTDGDDKTNVGDEVNIVYKKDEACIPLVRKP